MDGETQPVPITLLRDTYWVAFRSELGSEWKVEFVPDDGGSAVIQASNCTARESCLGRIFLLRRNAQELLLGVRGHVCSVFDLGSGRVPLGSYASFDPNRHVLVLAEEAKTSISTSGVESEGLRATFTLAWLTIRSDGPGERVFFKKDLCLRVEEKNK